MITAWDILTDNSLLETGTAWQHLNAIAQPSIVEDAIILESGPITYAEITDAEIVVLETLQDSIVIEPEYETLNQNQQTTWQITQ